MKKMMGIALLLALLCALGAAMGESETDLVVANPVITDRLNLREKPDTGAESLGRYYSGTPVTMLSETGEWAYVRIGDTRGYMLKSCLRAQHPNYTLPTGIYSALAKGTLRAQPKNTADTVVEVRGRVTVLGDVGDDWRHVAVNGYAGYIRTAQLSDYQEAVSLAYIRASDDGQGTRLYADADLEKSQGLLYNGAEVRVTGLSRAGWARVELPSDATGQTLGGYVHSADLSAFEMPWEIQYDFCTGIANRGFSFTNLYDGAAAHVQKGAAVTLLGDMQGQWLIRYAVDAQNLLGLTGADNLQFQDRKADRYGPERLGYALLLAAQDTLDAPDGRRIGWADAGQTVEFLSETEGYVQLRDYQTPYYLPKESVKILLREDLYAAPGAGFAAGAHTIGESQQGLYLFTVAAGAEGTLRISQPDWKLDQTFAVTGAEYAVFLPAGAKVTITGAGNLMAMEDHPYDENRLITPEKTVFTGSGRFFCDLQLNPVRWYSYAVTPLPGAEESYYTVSSLNSLSGGEERVDVKAIWEKQGEASFINTWLQPGMFLEFHNCVVVLNWGNG